MDNPFRQGSTSRGLGRSKDLIHCIENDPKIERQGPILDVFEIQLCAFEDILVVFHLSTISADLRQTCNSRFGEGAAMITYCDLAESPVMDDTLGTRSNNAHVPKEDIQELRKTIKGGFSQEPPHRVRPWIAARFPLGATLAAR